MKEVEVKILEIDAIEVEKKLVELGAIKVFEGHLVWTAFDFSDRRLSHQEMLLRLRKNPDTIELTLKKLVSADKSKTSEELEIIVNDFEVTKKILFELGLQEKRGYPLEKERISYKLGSTHFEIDTIPEFPTYLEIEGPDEESIKEYAEKLGFSEDVLRPWGTREVFAYYRGIKKTN